MASTVRSTQDGGQGQKRNSITILVLGDGEFSGLFESHFHGFAFCSERFSLRLKELFVEGGVITPSCFSCLSRPLILFL
jgi:hypothetical protein